VAKIKFELTQKAVDSLLQIERLYGRLEGMLLPQKLLVNLERDNLISSSFSSNKIEGNTLSLLEVTNLLLGERIPVNHEEQDVRNYFEALKKLPQYADKKINIETILFLHRLLFEKQHPEFAGKIRDDIVVVGKKDIDGYIKTKHNPPYHNSFLIQNALVKLIDYIEDLKLSSIVKCAIFHHQFLYLHPFIDGNGRVGRLLTTLLFLKYGYKINKYFILDDYYEVDRIKYSDMLHSADNGDLTLWIEYFLEGVESSLASSLAKVGLGVRERVVSLRLTKNEKLALELVKTLGEITTNDLAQEMKVTRQHAHNIISGIVNKGYLVKSGKGKSTFYRLK